MRGMAGWEVAVDPAAPVVELPEGPRHQAAKEEMAAKEEQLVASRPFQSFQSPAVPEELVELQREVQFLRSKIQLSLSAIFLTIPLAR